jgi:hypothetical protein
VSDQGPDPTVAPWPQYAEAIVELILDGRHLVLTPDDGAGLGAAALGNAARDPAAQDGARDELAGSATPIWVLTAGDPYPAELGPVENAARLQRLCDELDALGLQHHPALGRSRDGAASEVSRAVRGAERANVLAIAARHEQLAVYEIAARIDCVDVASSSVVTSRAYVVSSAPAGSDELIGPTGWRG